MKHAISHHGKVVQEDAPLPPGADPWLNAEGLVTHPNAPQNSSGFGSGSGVGTLGTLADAGDGLPHPQSPTSKYMDPQLLADKAEALAATPQPPPVVGADSVVNVGGIDVTIEKDRTGVWGVSGGVTSLKFDPGSRPDADTTPDNHILKITGPMPVITATIGTKYGDDPTGDSAYGRGTTPDDKQAGNTTLGFHESCHRQDHLKFIADHPLPKFGGKVKMTVTQWETAWTTYLAAIDAYYHAADASSEKLTDEVGDPKRSEYRKKHP
jgi:hypothetical protein